MISSLLLLFAMLVPPAVIAHWANVRFVQWRIWVVALASAAVVPAILMLPVGYIIVSAMTSSPERCGVDACGMAMVAGFMLTGFIAVLFLASFALNAVIVYRARRKATPDHRDAFE